MTPGFVTATVTRVVRQTPDLCAFELALVPPPFAPGQFFQLARSEGGVTVKRSYSAASAPGAPLEFFVSRVPGGALSPWLCSLEAGDEIDVDPHAHGFFTLDEIPPGETLWLLSTGTGLGPTISMLRSGLISQRFPRVVVAHGVRTRADLAYGDELSAFAARGELVYLPVVSREAPPPGGLGGRVTTALASGELERAAGMELDDSSRLLLCGNPAMIEEASQLLKGRGLRKHRRREPGHFHFEKYW